MIGIVVVTHGRLAEELVSAARTIHGELPRVAAVSLGWGDDAAAAGAAIERGIAEARGDSAGHAAGGASGGASGEGSSSTAQAGGAAGGAPDKPEASGGSNGEASGEGTLVLTDMFGGTPTNLSLPYLSEGVEIVTGVSLPMLIKAAGLREGALVEVARAVAEQGRGAIFVASEILAAKR